MNLILFDIDGTLLRTYGAGSRAVNRVFCELYSVDDAWGETKAHGKTDYIIFDEIALRTLSRELNPEEVTRVSDLYLTYFAEELEAASRFTVFPSVTELLNELADCEDTWVGLQTGNLEPAAWLKLRRAGIDHHFRFGGFCEDGRLRQEIISSSLKRGLTQIANMGIEPKRLVVVGDTPSDIIAGRENGATTVAVGTGNFPVEELSLHSPDFCFQDLSNQDEVLSAILGRPSA